MSFTVKDVAQLIKQAKDNQKPYVFFTGAGCSISAGVPSAMGLIDEIKKSFPIQIKNIEQDKYPDDYGRYMSALDKNERRELLKPYIIDNQKINWAHIALACLMQKGYVQRVLTFNFDSILSRACNLIGLYPSIYDFATANPHLYYLINDPAIVHLHGQGTGFVQLNTEEETKHHTEKLGYFIAATLNAHPSLFIGYSGNADAFFPLLEKKFSEQNRLIWTGTKDKIDDLASDKVKEFLKKNNNITHYIGKVDADKFLIELAQELECFPPELFLNPYQFLSKQLEAIQPYPLDDLDIVSPLREYLDDKAKEPLIYTLYTAFIQKYPNQDSVIGLDQEDVDQIMWAYDKQAKLLINQNKYMEAFELYERALSIQPNHIACLNNYGVALSDLGKSNHDEMLFKQAFEQYEKTLDIQPNHVDCLNNYGIALSDLGNINKDELLFKKAFEQYEKALAIEPDDANYLNNYGNALSYLGNINKDELLFKKAIEKYEKALAIEPYKADCLYNYGVALYSLGKITNDEKLFKQAIEQYEKALAIKPSHFKYLNNYGNALSHLGKINKDELLFKKAIEKYEKALAIEPDDALCLNNYGAALLSLGKISHDEMLLKKALEQYQKALQIEPNDTYNIACYYALINDIANCEKYLLHAEQHNTLPCSPYSHLRNDDDLDNVREEAWFVELLKRLQNSQTQEETVKETV